MHPAFAPALDRPIDTRVLIGFVDLTRWFVNTRGRPSAEVFAEVNQYYAMVDRPPTAPAAWSSSTWATPPSSSSPRKPLMARSWLSCS